jgi:hypothetical protein
LPRLRVELLPYLVLPALVAVRLEEAAPAA